MPTMQIASRGIRAKREGALLAWIGIVLFALPLAGTAVAADGASLSVPGQSLSLAQVVDNLVRKNAERSRNLLHSDAKRIYHLSYRGFPGDRDAEMTVEASYDSPSTKEFKIISQ